MFETLKTLDRVLLLKINAMHTPFMDGMMFFVSHNTWPLILIILLAAFVFYRKYSLKKAVEFTVGCALVFATTDLSTNLVKHAVKRYRPTHNLEIKSQVRVVNDYHGGKYGFFSAHAANNFSIITYIFLCIHWLKKNYKLFIFVYPTLIVYSRAYLGVHYPSDVFIGTISGLFFGWLGYKIMNKHFLKLDEQKA